MEAYISQAALLCGSCGRERRRELSATARRRCPGPLAPDPFCQECGFDPDDEESFDSEDFPKGPYADGGGESDAPQHCDACGLFLENPLTRDGLEYVRRAIEEARQEGRADSVALTEWLPFYVFELDG